MVTAGLAESNGRVYGFGHLTTDDRDQLRHPTLVSSMGLPYLDKMIIGK